MNLFISCRSLLDGCFGLALYGEMEEGKEGDMSDIAVDTTTNTIYAGIRYFLRGS